MVYNTKPKQIHVVEKSFAAYAKSINKSGQLATLQNNVFENMLVVIQLIKKGLPYNLFEKIKTITPFSDEERAKYLILLVKTLQRNKREEGFLFKPIHSERIIEPAEIAYLGHEIFVQ